MEELKPRKLASIRIDPGKVPYYFTVENTLDAYQEAVGGYIELIHGVIGKTPVAIICDEEGRLKGYEHCCNMCGTDFVGSILILSEERDGEDMTFASCELGLAAVCEEYYRRNHG